MIKPKLPEGFEKIVSSGGTLFCASLLAKTEKENCEVYYAFMRPNSNAIVVDLGCGIGGWGDYLRQIDPTLQIINVVNDDKLVSYMVHQNKNCIKASFDNTPIPDACCDNVMFNESIGHGELPKVIREAARILKTGGVLTVKDFSPVSSDVIAFDIPNWNYSCMRPDIVVSVAASEGLTLDSMRHPKMYMRHWFDIMGEQGQPKNLLGVVDNKMPLRQTLYRFIKGDINAEVCI